MKSGMANCNGCGSQWDKQTAPVGSFKPNPFGLYDTAGNVQELVEDCWHDSYRDAPANASAWGQENGGNCGRRVMRGGSWAGDPGFLRASVRASDLVGLRGSRQGPSLTKPKFIEPMYARLVNELPEGRDGSTRSSSMATAVSPVGIQPG
jgi:hypothetical protein